MPAWISWKHLDTDLPLGSPVEKKIEVFQARVWGWQLHIGDLVVNGGKSHDKKEVLKKFPHSGFAALQILMSYFEMIARYETGNENSDSKELFIQGMISVFPEITTYPYAATRNLLNKLWADVRCGFYHLSKPGSGLGVSAIGKPLEFTEDPPHITIDPRKFACAVEEHFQNYIARLKDPTQTALRATFEKRFNRELES